MKRFSMRSTALACLTLGMSLSAIPSVRANPAHDRPADPIDRLGLVDEAQPLFEEATKLIPELEQAAAQLQKKPEPRKFPAAHTAVERFKRVQLRLKQLGEPASWDLRLRASAPSAVIEKTIFDYLMTDAGGQIAKKASADLRKADKKRLAMVESIDKLARQNKWQEAEQEWDKALAALWPKIALIGSGERNDFLKPFDDLEIVIQGARAEYRQEVLGRTIGARIEKFNEERQAFFANIKAAATQLGSSSQATMGSESLPVAAAVKRCMTDFGAIHVGLMQSACFEFLATSSAASPSYGTTAQGGEHPAFQKWLNEAEASTRAYQEGIDALVAAEAARATGAEARASYLQLLPALSQTVDRVEAQPWLTVAQPSLQKLAQSGGLASQVGAYQEATSDLLRWRARATALRVAGLTEKKSAVSSSADKRAPFPVLQVAFREMTVTQQDRPGFYSPGSFSNRIPKTEVPLAQMIPLHWPTVNSAAVSVRDIIRFDSEKPLFMSRYEGGLYVRPKGEIDSKEAAKQLREELLVDDQHPPLTLEATYAIAALERGELAQIGGSIVGMNIESVASRFAKMPPIAGQFLRYPLVQSSAFPGDEMSAYAIRFDVVPQWFASRYGVWQITAAAPVASAP